MPLVVPRVPGDGQESVPDLAAQVRLRHPLQLRYENTGDCMGGENLGAAFLSLDLDSAPSSLGPDELVRHQLHLRLHHILKHPANKNA